MNAPPPVDNDAETRLAELLDQALIIARSSSPARPAVARHIDRALQSLRDPHTSIRVEDLSSANDG